VNDPGNARGRTRISRADCERRRRKPEARIAWAWRERPAHAASRRRSKRCASRSKRQRAVIFAGCERRWRNHQGPPPRRRGPAEISTAQISPPTRRWEGDPELTRQSAFVAGAFSADRRCAVFIQRTAMPFPNLRSQPARSPAGREDFFYGHRHRADYQLASSPPHRGCACSAM